MRYLFSTSRDEAALFDFPPLFLPLTALLALVMQAYLPLLAPRLAAFVDFPLLVVAYYGLSSRNQVNAIWSGSLVGIAQDSLTHVALGLNGLAKTLVGYLAASLGLRLDAEHPGMRFLAVFGLGWLNAVMAFAVERFLMVKPVTWLPAQMTVAAVVNAVLAVLLFRFFDRFRRYA